MPADRLRVLFLRTGNSCRSQMAEAWANALRGDVAEAHPAGTAARGMSPLAVRAMGEAGVDISRSRSTSLAELADTSFDVVVTVCDSAREACPVFPGGHARSACRVRRSASAVARVRS